ncbi:MAG: sensor histidine kinase, partial [Anaerolineales bacterium]|nr:sensor histidine kinase [Anaerolineales bacterium]
QPNFVNGKTYFYRVRAKDNFGNVSTWSDTVAAVQDAFPPDDVASIFEELYRGSNARGKEGSGLGLALVNRIASLHGGGVGVRSSQTDPRGTVFTLRLPRR